MRLLAIGDVHGCADHLDALLAAVVPTGEDHVVFLGDLVDRGPDSCGVIDRVLRLRQSCRVTVVRGNHEQMMLAARDDVDRRADWMLNGGNATLRSYAEGKLRNVLAEHWWLIEHGTVDYLQTDDHLFVHANAYPDVALAD